MSRSGNGVEVRDTPSAWPSPANGGWRVACRETIYQGHEPLAPTPPNVRYAHRVAEEIRRQLRAGHRVKVLREVYSRWLPGADGGRQKALMEAVFGKQEGRKVG